MPEVPQKKIGAIELSIRSIDGILPHLTTKELQKWQGILKTTLFKVEKELTATYQHTCKICFFQEWGYRDELPAAWYKKGDAEICFNHEYDAAEALLKQAGYEIDAFFPPEIPNITTEALQVKLDHLPDKSEPKGDTLEELMDLL